MLLLLRSLRQPFDGLSLKEEQSQRVRVSNLILELRFSKVDEGSIFDNSLVENIRYDTTR